MSFVEIFQLLEQPHNGIDIIWEKGFLEQSSYGHPQSDQHGHQSVQGGATSVQELGPTLQGELEESQQIQEKTGFVAHQKIQEHVWVTGDGVRECTENRHGMQAFLVETEGIRVDSS